MSDDDQPIEQFLDEAETVYGEYENGYVDADVALSQLEGHIEELRRRVE